MLWQMLTLRILATGSQNIRARFNWSLRFESWKNKGASFRLSSYNLYQFQSYFRNQEPTMREQVSRRQRSGWALYISATAQSASREIAMISVPLSSVS